MISTIEQRKNDFKLELEEKYRERAVKSFWQNKNNACRDTKIVASESYIYYNNEEVVIENEFNFYRLELAFLSIGACVTFIMSYLKDEIWFSLFGFVFSILLYFQYERAKKKRVFINITKEGIQLENEPFIAWNSLIASFVLTEGGSDETNYYLLMYHDSIFTDEFLLTKYKFEEKGMDYQDICFLIEYWKNKTNNK